MHCVYCVYCVGCAQCVIERELILVLVCWWFSFEVFLSGRFEDAKVYHARTPCMRVHMYGLLSNLILIAFISYGMYSSRARADAARTAAGRGGLSNQGSLSTRAHPIPTYRSTKPLPRSSRRLSDQPRPAKPITAGEPCSGVVSQW